MILPAVAASARQRPRAVLTPETPAEPVASSITITPNPFNVVVSATTQLTATVYDQFNNEMAGQSVSWGTSNAGVATVSGSGLVTGVGVGSASITASVTGASFSSSADCTVSSAAVASVSVTPSALSLTEGATSTLTFQPRDAGGNALSGRTVTGSSVDTGTATIGLSGYTGTVTAVAEGSTTVKGTCEGVDSASVTVTVSAPADSLTPNLPAGMSLHIDSDLSGIALDTPISTMTTTGHAAGNMGLLYDGTGGANMRIQTLSSQSWRNGYHTALPSCPNGYDRIHVCQFGTADGSAYSITAGEKGRYLMNLPANTASVYIAAYLLIGSNWYGQSGSGDWKKWYMRTTGEGPTILSFKGAGTGTIRTSAYVGAHTSNITGATDTAITEAVDFNNMQTMTRNTWYLVEGLFVTESSSNAGDAHMTYWVDGVKKFQITACRLTTGGGGNLTWSASSEVLHYYGGGGTTNVPISTGPMLVATGDHMMIYTSTSRVAVP